MKARPGVAWIYDHMTRGANDDQRDDIDAWLGDGAAGRRVASRRLSDLELAGGEIG